MQLDLTLLFLTLLTTIHALPSPPQQQQPLSPDRAARINAFNAQTPLHTTALLAGAAAKPTPASDARDPRIRDLRTVTGENGLWISLDDLRREGEEKAEGYLDRVRERIEQVREREGWGPGSGEI